MDKANRQITSGEPGKCTAKRQMPVFCAFFYQLVPITVIVPEYADHLRFKVFEQTNYKGGVKIPCVEYKINLFLVQPVYCVLCPGQVIVGVGHDPDEHENPQGCIAAGCDKVFFGMRAGFAKYSSSGIPITAYVDQMKTGFGWIEVGSVRYDHDIIIHVDRSITKRKKKLSKGQKVGYGHTPLSDAEVFFLTDERPDRVFIGTGQYGDLPVTPAAMAILKDHHAVIMPTPEILPLIGHEQGKYVAVLHVTC